MHHGCFDSLFKQAQQAQGCYIVLYTNIDQNLLNSLHKLLNCEIAKAMLFKKVCLKSCVFC